ncbi:hypothetical protein [Shimia sediminis]|uniref:hypothetical protein n=1 Tax=Shimia sediminis TaxID=2497945 RepID=UPI000F8D059F|nr:hypothetical protein [Shimia sediminis]
MAKAPGLYRPDGRPARQFGEEIIEPGEPFSGETLSTIRLLVSDHTPPDAPLQKHASAAVPAADPAPEPHPHPDPLPDEPETAADLNLTDLDAYAEDHLQTMQAMQEAAALSLPPPAQSPSDAQSLHPRQPSVRDSWRRLVIVEGGPGRALRSALARPRLWALALLVGLIAWHPWAIPFMVLTLATAVILFVLLAGAERVADLAGWGYARLKKRNPARADLILQRGNRVLTQVPWLADRLPPEWVQGFDIPEQDRDMPPSPDDTRLKSRLERMAAEETRLHTVAKGT